jgi:hypothetical protein
MNNRCGCAQCQKMGIRSRDEMCIVESLRASVNLHPKFIFVGFPLVAYVEDVNDEIFGGVVTVEPEFFTGEFDRQIMSDMGIESFSITTIRSGEDRRVSNQEMLKR